MQSKINGLVVNYEYVKRNQETILFLHGWGGGISSFKGVYNYFLKNSEYSLYSLDKSEFSVYNKSNILWEVSP